MSDTIDCPKCNTEHEPTGSHEDDSGEFTCEECGFVMVVEIEYDPVYWTSCVRCEFKDDWKTVEHKGKQIEVCHCVNCGAVKLKDQV